MRVSMVVYDETSYVYCSYKLNNFHTKHYTYNEGEVFSLINPYNDLVRRNNQKQSTVTKYGKYKENKF